MISERLFVVASFVLLLGLLALALYDSSTATIASARKPLWNYTSSYMNDTCHDRFQTGPYYYLLYSCDSGLVHKDVAIASVEEVWNG